MNFKSYERQDEFVVKLQQYIKTEYDTDDPKYYLDVAAGDPVTGSNTYVLDVDLQWQGLAFDIAEGLKQKWNENEERTAEFSIEDVTSENFTNLLSMRKNKLYDYLSLDVDTGTPENKSHTALARILNAGVRFKICTYEHESFKYGDKYKLMVREALEQRGYKILFPDVCFANGTPWEDWIIDPEYFSEELMALSAPNKTFAEIIDML